MKIGTENKKATYAAIVLSLGAVVSIYVNFFSDSSPSPAPKSVLSEREASAETPNAPTAAPATSGARTAVSAPRRYASKKGDEFRPSMLLSPEAKATLASVDPTLHTARLEKLQAMKPEGGDRNLFQFGAAPKPVEQPKGPEPKVVVAKNFIYPQPDKPPAPPPPPPPPPPEPAIDLKYYGLATKKIDGKKTAFFIDPEQNIILAPEGGMVKKKYKVVRVGNTSVLMENTENKKQQTITLAEDAGASMSN